MDQNIIAQVEASYLKAHVPEFRVGDTVDVHQKIVEGAKSRIQVFNGVVIARKGGSLNEQFTVRRIVANQGVERIFMLHSPQITKVDVKRRGKTRRAKLYYLRDRVGKARKLRELRQSRVKKKDVAQNTAGNSKTEGSREPVPAGADA